MSWLQEEYKEIMIGLQGSIKLHVRSWPVRLENVLEHSDVFQVKISIAGQEVVSLQVRLVHGSLRSARVHSAKRVESFIEAIDVA